jgi:hypothetical protein
MSADDRHRGGWLRLQAELVHVCDVDGRPKTDDCGGDKLLEALMREHPERKPETGICEPEILSDVHTLGSGAPTSF